MGQSAPPRYGDPETVQVGMPLGGQSIMTQDCREAVLDGGDTACTAGCSFVRSFSCCREPDEFSGSQTGSRHR